MSNKNIITSNNELTFTKNYDIITSSTKLSLLEKLVIARILNWQQSNRTCTLSNPSLAKELGTPVSTIRKCIVKLNKTTFFKSTQTSHFNEFNAWSNSKEMVIDEQKLLEFVQDNSTIKTDEKSKSITSEITTQNIPSEIVDETSAAIEIIASEEPIQTEEPSTSIIENDSTQASEIDSEITDDTDIDTNTDEDEETFFDMIKRTGYSSIEFNNFKIPNHFVNNWTMIQGQKGSMNNLRKSNSQFDFHFELKRIIDENPNKFEQEQSNNDAIIIQSTESKQPDSLIKMMKNKNNETKYDLVKFLQPYCEIDGKINDYRFDEMINITDLIKKQCNSTNLTYNQLITSGYFIQNQIEVSDELKEFFACKLDMIQAR